MNRRAFLAALLLAAAVPIPAHAALVCDRHTGLQSARVAAIHRPHTVDDVVRIVRNSRRICTGGRLHSAGGQQFLDGAQFLDMTGMARILHIEDDFVDVEPGVQWPELVKALPLHRTIRQKQTISTVTIGGTVSANAHGNALTLGPVAGDVLALDLVDAEGVVHTAVPGTDWFRMAVGGYGLVGVITRIRLRLQPRVRMRVLVDLIAAEETARQFARRRAQGALYASCELDSTLTRATLVSWTPDPAPASPLPPPGPNAWLDVMKRLHRNPQDAHARMAAAWVAVGGRCYWLDDLLTSEGYVDGYHRAIGPGCDPIVECLVPFSRLPDLLDRLRGLPILLASVRAVQADTLTALPYAPRDSAAVAVLLHQAPGTSPAFKAVQRCIELGGAFHPAFGRYASREQFETCFPWAAFVRDKQRLDPRGLFTSGWYEAYAS